MKKNGFTLLEILLALVLFTMGVVAIAGLFSSGLVGSADAENTNIAMNLAQRRMEEIRNLGYGNIEIEPKDDVDGFPGFQREVAMDEPEDGLKQVTVTVYWTHRGDEVSAPLVTYISRT